MTIQTLKKIRQRLGYDENDSYHDEEIMKMSLDYKMDTILGWEFGYSGWWNYIKNWLEECGHKLDK